MTWHYEKNGIRHDNVTEDDITGLIMRGELTASTLVWRQGMTEWQPISATPLASALLHSTTPPALPGNRIPGGVVWTLAFAPFIGYALELWTAGLNGMSFDEAYEAVSDGEYWFITLLSISLWGISMNDVCVRPEWIPPRSVNWLGWCRSICGDGLNHWGRDRLTSGSGWSCYS